MDRTRLGTALAFASAAAALCLASPLTAAEPNPLIGEWQAAIGRGDRPPIARLTFTAHSMEAEEYGEIPVQRYEIEGGWIYVVTGFGDSFAFELTEADRVCLSGGGAERWCYERRLAAAPRRD